MVFQMSEKILWIWKKDVGIAKVLSKIVGKRDVKKVVCFPDVHYKKRMEFPSSVAVGVKGRIIPELSSCALNCGMTLLSTNLKEKDVEKFFEEFKEELKSKEYDLDGQGFEDFLLRGGVAAVERYGLPKDTVDKLENGGRFSVNAGLKNLVPRKAFLEGKKNLGTYFGGNHFLELQKVVEVYEDVGLKKGQIVIFYHTGGGVVPYYVGRYFGNRKKDGWVKKIDHFVNKVRFHLFSFDDFFVRLRSYFFRGFNGVLENSKEGNRLVNAIKVSMNYGYAYRMATFARLRNVVKKNFGGEVSLVCDTSHNSIQKENGLWVHRHNASRVEGLSVLSGNYNCSSYLCKGGKQEYLFSMDHGAGAVMKGMDLSKREGSVSLYSLDGVRKVSRVGDEGVDFVLKLLGDKEVVKPVAKLEPIANFKR